MRHIIHSTITIVLLGLLLPPVTVLAEEQAYGWQLMSEQERVEHRNKMMNMKTEEERQTYRYEHHKKMEMRAKEQGVTLPDMPRDRMRNGGQGGMMGGQGGGRR